MNRTKFTVFSVLFRRVSTFVQVEDTDVRALKLITFPANCSVVFWRISIVSVHKQKPVQLHMCHTRLFIYLSSYF